MTKPVFKVSDEVRHKRGCCTAPEDGYSFEISDYGIRGSVCSENKGADQLQLLHS